MITSVACWEMFKHTDGDSVTVLLAGTSREAGSWQTATMSSDRHVDRYRGAGGRAAVSCPPPDGPSYGSMGQSLPEPTRSSFTKQPLTLGKSLNLPGPQFPYL